MNNNRSEFIKARVREGFQNGTSKYATRRCYGYDVTVDGSLVINPDEAKIIRWMFQRYLHGDSLGKIVSGLEKQGILSPTGKSKWNISEVARGTNRGLYKDCLHAVYMPYCTSFFTRDKHFVQMANDDTIGLWNRVVSIESFCEDLRVAIERLKSADGIDESKIDPCLPNNRLD